MQLRNLKLRKLPVGHVERWCTTASTTAYKLRSCSMNQASTKKKLLLGGYFSAMKDEVAKKRYLDKLQVVGGLDPYETGKNEWEDDVDL